MVIYTNVMRVNNPETTLSTQSSDDKHSFLSFDKYVNENEYIFQY